MIALPHLLCRMSLFAGTAIIFASGKRNEDFTTGKRNISRPFRNMITLLASSTIADHVKTTGHNIKCRPF